MTSDGKEEEIFLAKKVSDVRFFDNLGIGWATPMDLPNRGPYRLTVFPLFSP